VDFSAVDEELRSCRNRGISNCFAAFILLLPSLLLVVGTCHGKDSMRSFQGCFNRRFIIQISLDHFYPFLLQSLSSRCSRIACSTANFILLRQLRVGNYVVNDGATLLACSTKDNDELAHCS